MRPPAPALRPYLRHLERLPFVHHVEELSAARYPELDDRIRVTTPTGKGLLLVYLDLLAEGQQRAREAAAEIYRRYLDEAGA